MVRKALVITLVTAAMLFGASTFAQGQRAGQANFGQLISALNNINVQVDRLNALNDLTIENVQLVRVDNLLRGANIEAFNNALNRNNVQILQDFLNQPNCSVVAVCESLNNVLNNNNVQIGQVVAVDVLSGGDVIVFHR